MIDVIITAAVSALVSSVVFVTIIALHVCNLISGWPLRFTIKRELDN